MKTIYGLIFKLKNMCFETEKSEHQSDVSRVYPLVLEVISKKIVLFVKI